MPNIVKSNFLEQLEKRYGKPKKLPGSLSLFEIGEGLVRIYIRYSKLHSRNQSFYGIRKDDLRHLEGFTSFICFLWDNQDEPLFVPLSDFEDILNRLTPASDGQIKAQIFSKNDGTDLYLANVGRFSVEAFFGWQVLEKEIDKEKLVSLPDFSHSQIQTLLGSIGNMKGFDVLIPSYDRAKLDWILSHEYNCTTNLPSRYQKVSDVIQEIDVIWLNRGGSNLVSMFEVEHSTQIYSGLLRFNDLYLTEPKLGVKYNIVSNDIRRSLFLRQINRPTFKSSGLSEICSFLDYKDVFTWFNRAKGSENEKNLASSFR